MKKILVSALLGISIIMGSATGARAQEDKIKTEFDSLAVLPFGRNVSRINSSSYTVSLTGDDINRYPALDFRNMLVGLIPGLEVTEINGSPDIPSNSDASVNMLSRAQTLRAVIDDVPVDLTQVQLDPEEIESITLMNDIVSKARFGPHAADGIIYIRTKHGIKGKNTIRVNVESGAGIIDRFPEWADGTEYAILNNLARNSNGRPSLYNAESLEGFARRNSNDLKYPNTDFRELLLKDTKSFTRASFNMNGGTDAVRYNVYLGYGGEGDILKLGSVSDFNRINIRSSIDARITKDLSVNVSFYGGVTFRRAPRYITNNYADGSNFAAILTDANTIPPVAFPLVLGTYSEEGGFTGVEGTDNLKGRTIYGISSQYQTNPLAAITEQGFRTERTRSGMVNTTLTYDFSSLVKGLKSVTFINLNTLLLNRQAKQSDYLAYYWNSMSGTGDISDHKGAKASGKTALFNYALQTLSLYETLSYDRTFKNHKVGASATYYLSSTSNNQNSNFEKQQNGIFEASYSYDDRYSVQLVGTLAGSSRFRPGARYGFFPAAGAAWTISNERFMENVEWINFLKVRGEFGILGYENYGVDDLYNSNYQKDGSTTLTYGAYSSGQWFGSNTEGGYATTISRLGNPDLTWEKRREYEAGLDAVFLGNRLSMSATYFNIFKYDKYLNVNSTTPLVYGLSETEFYDNMETGTYQGAEISLRFSDKSGDFSYSIGSNMTYIEGKYGVVNEAYSYENLRKSGTYIGDYLGYVYLGKFESEEQIASSPKQNFSGGVRVGDLMYKDLNNDGKIDSNDRTYLHDLNTTPKVYYAINANFAYKWFDLSIVGTGRAGFKTALTNTYFWNGWGEDNYSKFVVENIGGAYPRLSYDKAENNFQPSSFWLRDGGWFKLQSVELGFNAPLREKNRMGIKGLRVYARGANLFTISGIKDVDPENINAGVTTYPLFRTFTGGVRFTF